MPSEDPLVSAIAQGRTIRDTITYARFADAVEPVSNAYSGLDEEEERRLDEETIGMLAAAKRPVERLHQQERHLLASIDNQDPDKVAGGQSQISVAKVVPCIVSAARPASAKSTAGTESRGGASSDQFGVRVSPRPTSGLQCTSRRTGGGGGGHTPVPPALAVQIPRRLQGVLQNAQSTTLSRNSQLEQTLDTGAARPHDVPTPGGMATVAGSRTSSAAPSRPPTASQPGKRPSPPPPSAAVATTVVSPRPPTAASSSGLSLGVRPGSTSAALTRPVSTSQAGPAAAAGGGGTASGVVAQVASAATTIPLVQVRHDIASPSERIASNEMGARLRTPFQQRSLHPRVLRHTFRVGPPPIPAVAPAESNRVRGVDPSLSHFLDANDYCPHPDDIVEPGVVTHARYVSQRVVGGEFRDVMRQCRVLAYHPEFNTYTIQWIHSNKKKVVKPLVLMFPWEDVNAYIARVTSAEDARDHDEAMLRFRTYAAERFTSDVVPCDSQQMGRVVQLVALRFEEQHLGLVNRCMDEVEDLWVTSIRESIAKYHLSSRVERAKVEALRLPHWRRVPVTDVLSRPTLVPVVDDPALLPPSSSGDPRASFTDARERLGRELLVAHQPLYRTISFAVQRWRAFEQHLLVDTDLSKFTLPMEVADFRKHQSMHNARLAKALEREWIASVSQAIQTELDGTFDFFINSVPMYNSSRMARFIRVVNLMLAGQLQGLVYNSLEAAKELFKGLRVDASTLQAVRDEGPGGRNRKSSAFLRQVGCFAVKVVEEPPFAKVNEPNQLRKPVADEPFGIPPDASAPVVGVIKGIDPLLNCRLTVDTRYQKMICTPTMEETEDAIREIFGLMLETTDALAGVGAALFPMLNLRPMNLTEHARSIRRSDERVKACEKEMVDMLEENLSGPKALLALYRPFSYLLSNTTAGFLSTFKGSGQQQQQRTVEEYDVVCDRLNQHMTMIENRSLNQVDFPLVRVECYGLKQTLIAKAKEILHAILSNLVTDTNAHIDNIDRQYSEIYETIRREPESPEELQDLKAFVDVVPRRMNELQQLFDTVTNEVRLLSKYGYLPDQAAFEKYWGSYSWPRKISTVMDDVPFHLQMFRAQFLAYTRDSTTKLQEAIADCARAVNLLSFEENEAMVDDVVRRVGVIDETLQQLKRDTALANSHEQIFQQPITKWPQLKDVEKQFLPLAALWRVTAESREVEKWADLCLERLEPHDINTAHASWLKEIHRLGKLLLHEISFTVVKYVKDKLEAFKGVLPVINALAKPSLLNRRRHVAKIADMLKENSKTFDLREKTPNELVRLGIVSHMTQILEISENADHEFKLEAQLAAMRDEWQRVNFTLQPYLDTYILQDTDDIRDLADEHVTKTQTMLASPYASAILSELKPWEDRVIQISKTLDAWLQCQFGFKYLSPMFLQSDDISVALPEEARSFEVVHNVWRSVMDSVAKVPSVLIRCSEPKLLEQFQEANTRIDVIMREISRYLDLKREAFPRFYFLSNEDLIDILSRSREPQRIQPFLQKCFEGIHRLTIEPGEESEVVEMVSSEGEVVGLYEPVFPLQFDNVVDRWIVKLEQTMVRTVQSTVEKALNSSKSIKRQEWITLWPGQACIAASQVLWTVDAEDSILRGSLATFVRRVRQQVKELAMMVREDVSVVTMCTLQALIVIMVHARDVAVSLMDANISTLDDFAWSAQLRYYWENKKLTVRQTIATLPYGYEYLGNSSRLVITPLTDRCYRTLTAAYHLNFGGAPEGPAGTGKTETTKDLAKAIAKMCVVYNCSDQIKAFEMEKLLRGLAACGAWGCFDEFNRIEVQVLSIIAQQVLSIQLAVVQKRPQFLFEDRLCAMREGCSIFITMNPGYAGRTELPDNLKALFRPVAMMVPDYVFIAENSLYSCGFLQATGLAKKIVACYKLSSEQLSSQSHYDFGMRAVKSVLSAAQQLRQSEPHVPEAHLVMRAILDVNKPKFLANDALLFDGIVSDLFGRLKIARPNYAALDEGLSVCAAKDNLQTPPFFLGKIRQLYELVKVRHGIMLVGQSISGKSAALHLLAQGLTWAFHERGALEPCHVHTLNPKAVSLAQLYGHNDASGTEWYDGILSHIFRECATATASGSGERHWITLDGPVDSIWIENMNTVLDDNKKLCLTNGDMIRMTSSMTMVFVVQDLYAASPATVSRCGMVYFEASELGWEPLFESWKFTLTPELEGSAVVQTTSASMVTTLLPAAIDFVVTSCVQPTQHSKQMMRYQFFRMYRLLLVDLLADGEKLLVAPEADVQQITEGICFLALTWGVGGLLNPDDRNKFDTWLRSHVDMDGRKADAYRTTFPLPEHASIFQVKLEVPPEYTGRPSWVDWLFTVGDDPMEAHVETPFQELMVNTHDTVSMTHMCNLLLKHHEPLLFVGQTATGKTMLVKNVLRGLNASETLWGHVQFSAQTTSKDLQVQLLRRLERRGQRRYGPPLGKSLIVFVDDLGMPEADAYGTVPPIELLRQLLSQRGWYSTSKSEFGLHHLEQLFFVSATQPAGSGRSAVTNRLLRHFTTLVLPVATPETMRRIYGRLYEWIMLQPNVNPSLRGLRDSLVSFTVDLFTSISHQLLPSPSKSHYMFNLRDVGRVWLGVSGLHGPTTRDDTSLMSLVVHECVRVFSDRLVNDADRAVFNGILNDMCNTWLRRPSSSFTGGGSTDPPLLYSHFLHVHAGSEERTYARATATSEANIRCVQEHVNEMYETVRGFAKQGSMVVFDYLVQHVVRVARIIQQPSGSVLLMGLGGTGRRSCARIAAHICGFTTRSITVTTKYTRDSWAEDIIQVLRQAGERGHSVLFLLCDGDIKEEGFLEDVSSILNSGEVPGLLNTDVQEAIAHTLKNTAKELGRDFGRDGCMELFVQRVKTNLHFALCFSPAGDALRVRLRRFPSLMNCVSMNWMPVWPTEALSTVAATTLSALADVLSEGDIRRSCVMLQSAFEDVSFLNDQGRDSGTLSVRLYLTPTAFLDLLSTFVHVLRDQRAQLDSQIRRYEGGLQVVHDTEKAVTSMQETLEVNRPKLVAKSAQVAELIAEIDVAQASAKAERDLVAVEESQANAIAQDAKAVFDDCEANLAVALPAMNAATEAVSQIDKKQLVELRSLANPSEKIKKVIEAVCILLEVQPKVVKNPKTQKKELDYWTPTKTKVMADVESFRDMLMNYDKNNMKAEIFEDKIQPFIKDKTFRPETVKDVSQALVGVTQWVLAMETYYRVRKIVQPKQEKLAAAEAQLKACRAVLAEKKRVLQEIDDKLAVMTQNLTDSIAEKEALEHEQQQTEIKLARAVKLITGLADEKVRYEGQVVTLHARKETILADCLYSSLVLALLGPYPQEMRTSLRAKWYAQLYSPAASGSGGSSNSSSNDRVFNDLLSSAVEELQWKLHGLPLDMFSVDSAVIAKHARKYPYFVDPEGQAVAWLKHMHAADLVVVKHNASDMYQKMKEAVSQGKRVLLEECPEELDPFLYPILDREVTTYNGAKVMTLGDSTIAYNEKVTVYLATKVSKSLILPSTSSRVTVLMFSITPSGLCEQLLQRVIGHEDRDQEEKRNRVVEQQAASQVQLVELEDAILTMLASGKDLLADDDMCEQLDNSKRTSLNLNLRLQEADSFQKAFEKIRQRYLLIATKGSSLYFSVVSLSVLNCMYEFSLSWFTSLLLKALERPHEEGESRTERCLHVLETFYRLLFSSVTRGLFAKDKLVFTLMMLLGNLAPPPAELRLFIKGPLDVPLTEKQQQDLRPDDRPEFLTLTAWKAVLLASTQLPPPLASMAHIIRANHQDVFARYCTEDPAHSEETHAPLFNEAFAQVLTPVQRLILIRLIAPRFLVDAVRQVIASVLGQDLVTPPPLDIERSLREGKDPTVPVVFIVAPGGDPLAGVRRAAESVLMSGNLDTISLGSGMDARAAQLIKRGSRQGRWVVLQNCHLYPDFMPQLDQLVETISLQRIETNISFRLILTTCSTPAFPAKLLQRALKAVVEPPDGIQSNLKRLLHASPMTDPAFFESSKNPSVFKRLSFSLCLFHAVVQERRSFGPIGWNIPYDFTDTDLRISLMALNLFVNKAAEALLKNGVNLEVPLPNTWSPNQTVASGGGGAAVASLTSTLNSAGIPLTATMNANTNNGSTVTTGLVAGLTVSGKSPSARTVSDEELTAGLSFDGLQYLIGECNYGGRVTDVHDRRLLLELLREFVGQRLFDDDDPLLPMPLQGDISHYQQFAVEHEALISGPEVLGLDANSLILREERHASMLVHQLAVTMLHQLDTSATTTVDKSTNDKEATSNGPAVRGVSSSTEQMASTMLNQLPPPFAIDIVEQRYPPRDYDNSLNSVLVQELHRMNRLLAKIRSTLNELVRALRGEAVLTAELDVLSQELSLSATPKAWKSVSYPTLMPVGAYIFDLVRRLAYFQRWIDEGPPPVCWLGGLYFPQSFVTGTLQNFCRRERVNIDALTWKTQVMAPEFSPVIPPEIGCYIGGLFLEGCRWDSASSTLANAAPKVLVETMPTVHLIPTITERSDDLDDDDDGGAGDNGSEHSEDEYGSGPSSPSKNQDTKLDPVYRCPIYRTQERHGVLMTTGHSTNFLMYFDLPIPPYTKPSTWVKRGVAIFTTASQ